MDLPGTGLPPAAIGTGLFLESELSWVYRLWKMKIVHGSHQMEAAIRPYLRQTDSALHDCRINYFDAYQRLYGSKEAKRVTQMLEQLTNQIVKEIGRPEDVLGFESADHFVLVTSETAAPKIKEALKSRFSSEILAHYSDLDRERGYLIGHDNEKNSFHVHIGWYR